MTERLTCRAPHPDPRKPGRECGAELGVPDGWVWVGLTTRCPPLHERDADLAYFRCARDDCKVWNIYRWRDRLSA